MDSDERVVAAGAMFLLGGNWFLVNLVFQLSSVCEDEGEPTSPTRDGGVVAFDGREMPFAPPPTLANV